MAERSIVFYLHVHQPHRLKHYTIFDVGKDHNYFDTPEDDKNSNQAVMHKVAQKSYIPTNAKLLELLEQHPEFKLSLSITGTVLEQLEELAPDALDSFKKLVDTGRVEIVGETFHHSLAFFYNREEFETQVNMHKEKIEELFGVTPTAFRNTELAYNNELGKWADENGYKAVLAEGWDKVLGWRSPNFVYKPPGAQNVKLLLKNYKLSDDIAFRFGRRDWEEWPLTADKFAHWLNNSGDATNFDLFMDYETFGEHQWEDTGIFNFLHHLPEEWLKTEGNNFATISEIADKYPASDEVDVPHTITWADTERDLSAWLGNGMQQQAIDNLYELSKAMNESSDWDLIEDWRRLQTSDHFYYMCTKWFSDGDVHAYFSPYQSPYEAFINFMNCYQDLQLRLLQKDEGT